jgi:hypothetical protein
MHGFGYTYRRSESSSCMQSRLFDEFNFENDSILTQNKRPPCLVRRQRSRGVMSETPWVKLEEVGWLYMRHHNHLFDPSVIFNENFIKPN